MAAHILCHANEILPNSFPPPRLTRRDHGMMSEYEAPVVMQQAVPSPQVDGGLEITFDEDYPTLAPKAMPTFDLSELYDPALCLTPEKGSLKKTTMEKLNRGSDEGLSLRPQHSQKVRFDNFVEVKEMSPKSRTSVEEPSPGGLVSQPATTEDSLSSVLNTDKDSHTCASDQEIHIVSVKANDLKKKPNGIKPKFQSATRVGKAKDPAADNLSSASLSDVAHFPESILARPEFNSTLRVGRELQQVAESELNVSAAVKQKLQASNRVKTSISDKATSRLNTLENMFEDLVSLEVQEEELIGSVQRERASKAKPSTVTKHAKAEDNLVAPPDILDCLTPDLLRETASFRLDGLPPVDHGPRTAPLERAFDVFRHIHAWESW